MWGLNLWFAWASISAYRMGFFFERPKSHYETHVILNTAQEVPVQVVVMFPFGIAVRAVLLWKLEQQMTWEHGLWFLDSLKQSFLTSSWFYKTLISLSVLQCISIMINIMMWLWLWTAVVWLNIILGHKCHHLARAMVWKGINSALFCCQLMFFFPEWLDMFLNKYWNYDFNQEVTFYNHFCCCTFSSLLSVQPSKQERGFKAPAFASLPSPFFSVFLIFSQVLFHMMLLCSSMIYRLLLSMA